MRMPLSSQEEAKFSMAPMIDMVFLLLVFFMVASHLSSQEKMQMNIPTASHGVIPEERPNRWVVNINTNGSVFSGDQPITIEELKNLVAERVAEEPDVKVYLRADADSPHKESKKVMNAMAEAGIDQFVFGVYTPSGGSP